MSTALRFICGIACACMCCHNAITGDNIRALIGEWKTVRIDGNAYELTNNVKCLMLNVRSISERTNSFGMHTIEGDLFCITLSGATNTMPEWHPITVGQSNVWIGPPYDHLDMAYAVTSNRLSMSNKYGALIFHKSAPAPLESSKRSDTSKK